MLPFLWAPGIRPGYRSAFEPHRRRTGLTRIQRFPVSWIADGRLYLNPGRLRLGIVTGQVSLGDVEIELRAANFESIQRRYSADASRWTQAVHVLPGISDIVIRLAQEFSIPSVRCPWEEPPGCCQLDRRRGNSAPAVVKQYLVGRTVSVFARRFRQKLAEVRAALSRPTSTVLARRVFSIPETFWTYWDGCQKGTSELMCHPGYLDARPGEDGNSLWLEREVEISRLCSRLDQRFLEGSGIRLVNYQALARLP